ncbi:MAG TPA: sigma-54 dependent transcriptional regulator [Stellaceae bacterium]|jgi:DNA-binding NtrC family response regulator|nr:sigma-54 dependent transcriptional regulator [Stellaceae bacterium]
MSLRERGRIGIIEDNTTMGDSLVQRLELEGYTPLWWQSGQEALEKLFTARPDLVVCDIVLPDISGEEVFLRALSRLGSTPFLFVTGHGKIDQAVRLTKAGAVDYLEKPYEITDLLERIAGLIAVQPRASGVLGASPAMRQMELLLRRVADIDSSLLITGESGVGKEVAAQFVHRISTRASEPFIAVNCAAIPHELVESQLFGHERGSFTSAQARHRGHVERAGNGILFLDEVGELPMPMQAKLLRLIEERAFTRVGGEATIKTGARIICATNANLEAAVGERRFREDLYFRINVIRVAIPRLRERSEDILPLAQLFMREFSGSFERDVHGFTPEAEQALLDHPWPGNVRELRNRVEQAVALSLAPRITVEALFPAAVEPAVALSPAQRIAVEALFPAAAAASGAASFPTLAEVRDQAERQHIRAALAAADGIEEAARRLGVGRSTLFEKIRKLDIRSGIRLSALSREPAE